MKQLMISYLFMILPLWVSGQITQDHYVIRAGDKIVKQQVNYVNPGDSGEGVCWDFSKLTPVNEEYIVEYSAPVLLNDSIYIVGCDTFPENVISKGELVIGLEHYTAYYYRIIEGRLTLLGFENPVTLMHYRKPLSVMNYPFNYESELIDSFQSEGIYSQEFPLAAQGEVLIKADALGEMILPSGDTLKQVMRVKTTQRFQETVPKEQAVMVNPMEMILETYRWYARGYRYPIFETIHSLKAGKPESQELFKTAFFYPPEEHHYLEEDVENLTVLDEQKEAGVTIPEGTSPTNWSGKGSFWSCHFYPNPVVNTLNVVYQLDKDGSVTISLYDMSGRLQQSLPAKPKTAGYYHETLDCGRLPVGSYVLKLTFDGEVESRVILRK